MARLIQWDVDRTLLVGGGVGPEAFAAAFTAVTGVAWHGTLSAAGRTDLSITPELFAQHGIADAGAQPGARVRRARAVRQRRGGG